MEEERLTPELEKLLKQVRLKEPSQELMADYLTGVNAKIDRRMSAPHFGFREGVLVFAVGLILAGLFYFLLAPSLNHEPTPKLVTSDSESNLPQGLQAIIVPPPAELSLEEELALLEAFEEELSDQESDWLEDEELLEELALLDELEISGASGAQVAAV